MSTVYLPYTGIGSRETPEVYREIFSTLAKEFETAGLTLRSGAADGADTFFECGVTEETAKEIYLPWMGFNDSKSRLHLNYLFSAGLDLHSRAVVIAEHLHPAWNLLREDGSPILRNSVKKLHTRNVFQILGERLDSPSKFVLCWTKNGKVIGGTATAIKLAHSHGIPVYNFGDPVSRQFFWEKYSSGALY